MKNTPFRCLILLLPFLALFGPLPGTATAAENLIPNGTMEKARDDGGWPAHWGKAGNVTWGNEKGNRFLRLTSPAPGATVNLYQEYKIPADAKALELTWKQRISGLKTGKEKWFDARILMSWKDAAGAKMKGGPTPPYAQKNTKDWAEKTARFLVPEGAVSLVMMPSLFQVTSGTFDLDDMSLKAIDPEILVAKAKEAEELKKANIVPHEQPNKEKWPKELHVVGNRLHDPEGKEVWLQGVNAGGLETLWQDKQVLKSAVVATDEWKANAVRLPVKEEFWFGKGEGQKDGGTEYRERIDQVITLVANRGGYTVLDLHRFRAPKQEHADFWKDAAERYKNHPAVIFDLFNEPYGISWEVWRDGGHVGNKGKITDESAFLSEAEKQKIQGFESVGMQALLNAVRETGAKNLVVVGGLTWSSDLTGITNGFALDNKDGNGIIYGWHIYNWHKGWEKLMLAASEKHPILVGETGAHVSKMDFIPAAAQEDASTWVPDMLGFIQKHKLNWTGWCLHPGAAPIMISDWKYTPTPWGAMAKEALGGKQFELKRVR